MSHDHRNTDLITLMYAGDAFADEITAVYLARASTVLIREPGQRSRQDGESWGRAKKLVEVNGPLTEQQFTDIAHSNGALENTQGYMTRPDIGHMALSDSGSIILRHPFSGGDHIAFAPIGPGGPNWKALRSYGSSTDFHTTAAENFSVYHAHETQDVDPEVYHSVAGWLGEDVVKYLATAASPSAAPPPDRRAVNRQLGFQPGPGHSPSPTGRPPTPPRW